MPFVFRIDRSILWLAVLNAADRSSRMRTEDLDSALASLKASITESRAFSVEWPLLLFAVQEVVLFKKGRDLVESNSFKCFCNKLKEGYLSLIFQMCWI